jgi:hypothetical protein
MRPKVACLSRSRVGGVLWSCNGATRNPKLPLTSDPKRLLPLPLRLPLTFSYSCPSLVLNCARSLAPSLPGHCMVLGYIQQIRCRLTFTILTEPYQQYKVSYCFTYPTLQHISFIMQSPHDTSRGHSYQRHQNSLPSTHTPHYTDHHGQAAGYHPVVHNPQIQRPPYGTPQGHLHPGTHIPYHPV